MGTHYEGTARERRALNAYIKLSRCTETVDARLKLRLAERGLSVPQLAVLEALLHLGPMSQRELGERMLRTGGSVTSMVDKLEQRGWVVRQRDEDDRRVVHLHLTPEGRRLIARIFPLHAAAVAETFGALTANEQRELARLCKKLGLSLGAEE